MLEKKWIDCKIIIATILTIGLVGLIWHICPIMYQNNDDKFLLYMIAGYTTGTQSIATIFGGFLWAGFISLLYKIYAGVTWYTVITLLIIIISLVIICRSLLQVQEKSGILAGCLIYVGLFSTSLCYFITAIQYTVTAAYVGTASVCALLLAEWSERKKTKIIYTITCALFVVISFSIRKQMGLVTISCVAIVLFFMLLQNANKSRFAIKATIIIFASFAVVFLTNAIFEKATGLTEFNKDYAIVQRWIDYPHLEISDDSEGVYASIGWDESLYDAATEWFFLDERVTAENINVINKASAKIKISFEERLIRAWDSLKNKQIVNVQLALWVIVLAVANIGILTEKRDKEELLSLLCSDILFLFFGAVSFYFCFIQGRFPLRVYQALVYIYMFPSIAIIFKHINSVSAKKSVYAIVIILFLAVPFCYKLYPAGSMVYQAKLATHDIDRQKIISEVTALEEYAADNKNNLYIYDYELSQPAAPFVNFGDNMPYNILFWGGWTYDSPVYHQQLKVNGRDELTPADLVDGNVYLCGKEVDQVIYKYMQDNFKQVDTEIIDTVGDIIIYRYCTK